MGTLPALIMRTRPLWPVNRWNASSLSIGPNAARQRRKTGMMQHRQLVLAVPMDKAGVGEEVDDLPALAIPIIDLTDLRVFRQ